MAAQRKGGPRGSDVSSITRSTGKLSEPHGSTTSLALAKGSNRSTNLETTAFTQGSSNSSASIGWSMENTWDTGLRDTGLRDLDMPRFNAPLFVEFGADPLVVPWGDDPCLVGSGISALAPWDLSGPPLFERRTFSKPNQGPLVSLALQILRSYPFMMLRKGAMPPFINPLQASWAETGLGPQQQVSLSSCSSLNACYTAKQSVSFEINPSKSAVWILRH